MEGLLYDCQQVHADIVQTYPVAQAGAKIFSYALSLIPLPVETLVGECLDMAAQRGEQSSNSEGGDENCSL